ncbi:unnamed protein product [Amoebophrya sp. A25]|nr:unnamed protein product [Amoebophrya sp. A25]|eukprot:GSA25T00008358001.1
MNNMNTTNASSVLTESSELRRKLKIEAVRKQEDTRTGAPVCRAATDSSTTTTAVCENKKAFGHSIDVVQDNTGALRVNPSTTSTSSSASSSFIGGTFSSAGPCSSATNAVVRSASARVEPPASRHCVERSASAESVLRRQLGRRQGVDVNPVRQKQSESANSTSSAAASTLSTDRIRKAAMDRLAFKALGPPPAHAPSAPSKTSVDAYPRHNAASLRSRTTPLLSCSSTAASVGSSCNDPTPSTTASIGTTAAVAATTKSTKFGYLTATTSSNSSSSTAARRNAPTTILTSTNATLNYSNNPPPATTTAALPLFRSFVPPTRKLARGIALFDNLNASTLSTASNGSTPCSLRSLQSARELEVERKPAPCPQELGEGRGDVENKPPSSSGTTSTSTSNKESSSTTLSVTSNPKNLSTTSAVSKLPTPLATQRLNVRPLAEMPSEFQSMSRGDRQRLVQQTIERLALGIKKP